MVEIIAEKDKILNLTHELFITDGFYKTSMDEIARELQMSKKTIYKFFPSKEHLVEAVCDFRLDRVHKMISDIMETEDDSVTKFVKLLYMNIEIMKGCSEKWFKDLQYHAPMMLEKFDNMRNDYIYKIFQKLLEQGKREKLIQHYPSQVIITAFIGAVSAIGKPEFILNNKFSLQEALRITSEIFFNGFLTEQGKHKYTDTKKLFSNVIS